MEKVLIDGREYPRHPTYNDPQVSERLRLRLMIEGVSFALSRCKSHERPLHGQLRDCLVILNRSMAALGDAPSDPGTLLPWEHAERGR